MDSGLLLSSSDMDLAAAGSSASGGRTSTPGLQGPDVAAGAAGAGGAQGLAPPSSENQSPASGLQGPTAEAPPGGSDGGGLTYTQRVAKALGVDPYHIRYTDGPGGEGLHSAQAIPVAGGSGARAPAAEGAPIGISVNPRAAAAFDLLSNIDPNLDFTGTLEAIRNSHDIGSYLNELEAKGKVDEMRDMFRKNLMIPPTEGQLGVLPGYVNNENGEAVPVYDQKELLEHYRNAYRMSVLERQGSVELDHDNWKIKSIGSAKLTPEQFVEEIRNRYQAAFANGVNKANESLSSGARPLGDNVPEDLQRGIIADRHAQDELREYLKSINVPEGPGQLVALNRWAYFQDASGLHAQPDVLIDPGIEYRHILDGKATMFDDLSPAMYRQLRGYHDLGVGNVEATTQYGHIFVPREGIPRSKR